MTRPLPRQTKCLLFSPYSNYCGGWKFVAYVLLTQKSLSTSEIQQPPSLNHEQKNNKNKPMYQNGIRKILRDRNYIICIIV